MSKFLYPIYKLNIESYKKWWLYHKKAGGSGILSEILQGFSFNLENTLNRKFKLFEIEGNSVQDGSPSPNNEVPILSSGDNENIFDTSLLPITKNGVTISKDSKGNVVLNGTPNITSGYINFIVSSKKQLSAGTYTSSFEQKKVGIGSVIVGWGNAYFNLTLDEMINKKTATINDNGEAQFNINVRYDVGTLDNFIINPKLEKGNKASGYSPYGMGSINEKIKNANGTEEQDYSIFVRQPMRSIGDVRDCFVKKSDGWYERHLINRYIFTGEEDFNVKNIEDENILFQLDFSFAKNNSEVLCNNFKKINNIWANDIEGIEIADKKLRIRINKKSLTDITTRDKATASFKSYLAERYANGKPVYVDYLLEEPQDLPCTPEQVEQLENLPSTYKDFTIIQSEDETKAYLEVSGIYDLNKLITRTEVLESES